MSACVLIQTCDLYEPFWRGFWHFMEKQWDFDIEVPIYFCNEEKDANNPSWCEQIRTGRGTFVENLKKSLNMIEEDTVFLMLEDFWPIAPMRKLMFDSLLKEFEDLKLDALQISNYTPYYSLTKLDKEVLGQPLLRFEPHSEWLFNFQARFWKKEAILDCLVEPDISERIVSSAITAEMAADKIAREHRGLNVALFHYLWYPLSGVAYRGKLTEFGQQLENIVQIDKHVEALFNRQHALDNTRPEYSA